MVSMYIGYMSFSPSGRGVYLRSEAIGAFTPGYPLLPTKYHTQNAVQISENLIYKTFSSTISTSLMPHYTAHTHITVAHSQNPIYKTFS
jgi:hypothetical protein